ncbi:MAG: FAD-dependent thymidylate synthase [candidate division Zixibacteria bacterium]|nr:FAD-dependent thymidylate synthase [candidate division Zixibacteria bacterium]
MEQAIIQDDPKVSCGEPEAARRIYLMKDLPPEVVAVAFAKTSRSPEPFDQIAAELTEAGSAQFHEKWVVGYGHASVAEHAILSLAVENVSILAAKAIEDNRLASYTEKSTRYQIYDPKRVYRPAGLAGNPALSRQYENLITELLTTYIAWSEKAMAWLKREIPRPPDKSERLWESRLRAQACDAIRYLLPTATLTNLGWTINARALAGAIRKLTGSDLAELREIGNEVKMAALEKVPTLLKYSDPDLARSQGARNVAAVMEPQMGAPSRIGGACPPEARVLQYDPDGLKHLACAVAYANQPADWQELGCLIDRWSTVGMLELIHRSLAPLGPFDPLPRAFEHLNYLIEITVDYGAWRDIQRHRIGTQTAQELTPELGYAVPTLIDQLGLRSYFERLAGLSASTYDTLHDEFSNEAVYALMLAFRKRSLFGWNLREVCHFVKLRGTAKGHDAYRKVAHDLWRDMLRVQPWLGGLVFPLGTDFRP